MKIPNLCAASLGAVKLRLRAFKAALRKVTSISHRLSRSAAARLDQPQAKVSLRAKRAPPGAMAELSLLKGTVLPAFLDLLVLKEACLSIGNEHRAWERRFSFCFTIEPRELSFQSLRPENTTHSNLNVSRDVLQVYIYSYTLSLC